MQFSDSLGLEFSASSAPSIIALERITDSYLASRQDTLPLLDELIATDPQMPMASCFRGYLLKMAGDPRLASAARAALERAQESTQQMTAREALHVKALQSWLDNQYKTTLDIFETILADHPKDMLALRIAHYLHFYFGHSVDMCHSVARSYRSWQPDEPYYGYLLGMYSFGLEESGQYVEAENYGRHAVERNPHDIWAAHAVAHVCQMQERSDDGIEWINSLSRHWQTSNNFVYHLHWHKALLHITANEPDEALALYDAHLTEVLKDDFYLDICNAAALLWRLQIRGINVGDRWQALRAYSQPRVSDDELVFITLHYLMTPAILQDEETTNRAINHFQTWSREDTTQGRICRKVGLPLARSLVNLGAGNLASATSTLDDIANDIHLIGGSHAQRQLFTELLNHYKALV